MNTKPRQPVGAACRTATPQHSNSIHRRFQRISASWMLPFVLLVLTLATEVRAQFTFTTNDGTITITGYTGRGGTVAIPSSINGHPVTRIGDGAFEWCSLTSVTIPSSVTSLEDNAFQQCASLTSITIPDSVTNIGAGAFLMCCSLANVAIGTNVACIGSGAFFDCYNLISVTIPNSVTTIGGGAFEDRGMMTNLVIGNDVISIGKGAFEYCDGLRSVTIPSSVTSIGAGAFGSCDFLFDVYFVGDAPANDGSAFTNNNMVTVYYLYGTSGWSSTYGSRPAVSCATDLYKFVSAADDGEHPAAGLTLVGSTLYGTTSDGGRFGKGTIFAINTDGTGYTNLYSFGSVANDGAIPSADLTLAGSTLYGTTGQGGSLGCGTIFAINADGTGYTNLHFFGSVANDGSAPLAGLTAAGSKLFGTTQTGFGSSGNGTIFAINPDGTGYTILYRFGSVADDGVMSGSLAGLTVVGSKLYGTTPHGGYYGTSEWGYGTIFAINTDGSGYTNLYHFGSVANDGAAPFGGQLTLAGSTLYGTTESGFGSSSNGTIFAINTDGTGYTNLYRFGSVTNDGANPQAGLTLAGSKLYGTTYYGGSLDSGAIFAINTDGSGYTILASCAGLTAFGGAYPNGLTLVGSTLYGTTKCGAFGYGTVFALTTNTVQMAILTVQASPAAGGTVSGGGTFVSGSSQMVTAQANGGYLFANWTENGSVVSSSNSYTCTITGHVNLVANFTANPVKNTIAVSASPRAGGVITGSGIFASGGSQTVLAAPRIGYTFLHWTENGSVMSSSNSYTFTLSSNRHLVANFAPIVPVVTLITNGAGMIEHGPWPACGQNCTVKAVPKPGNLFSNWVGGTAPPYAVLGTKASRAFLMQSNFLLEANFVTNLFLSVQGSYNGLFAPTNSLREQDNSGAFTFTLKPAGSFSGKLHLGSQTVLLSGTFGLDGSVEIASSRRGQVPLTTTLRLDTANQAVTGTVSDGSFIAQLVGHLNVFNSRNKATAYQGRYTLMIPGATNAASGPCGTSCGTVSVGALGNISFSGSLADGTPVNQSSIVSGGGLWPFYLSLYGGKGSLWSWNYFTNGTIASFPFASWLNSTNAWKTTACRSGFTNQEAAIIGSSYAGTEQPLLSLTNGEVILAGGDLPFVITNQVTLTPLDKLTLTSAAENTNKLVLTINKTTGALSGSFANPANPKRTIKVNGVLLQNQSRAQGYFLGTNQSGSVYLGPE